LPRRVDQGPVLALGLALALAACPMLVQGGDARAQLRAATGEIGAPLTRQPGDAARGREVVQAREAGGCVTCHVVPGAQERFMGDLGPSLAGVGSRLSAGQLRLRLVDATLINPDTAMPSYYRTEGLTRVAKEYVGKPLLSAQQIEDAIAFLLTLK
jgi:L-cysteine S-thiosulfotransferase